MKPSNEDIFREHGGQMRMSEALAHGINRYALYAMKERGIIEQVSRGLYRLADLPPLSEPDLATVCLRYPDAVVCLVSALAFHGITTQVPHSVMVAVRRNAYLPSLDYPPVTAHKFSELAHAAGIEEHLIDGIPIKVYSPEKTLADCFKFRNKIGMDVVLEALKLYRQRLKFKPDELMKYARVCRVDKIMQPYLEASL